MKQFNLKTIICGLLGAVLLLGITAPLTFTSCDNETPEINVTLESDYSTIIDAIKEAIENIRPAYDYIHLRFYTFNPGREVGNFITQRDFESNDGSVVWWTRVNPSYNNGQGSGFNSISNRYALKEYDVAPVNLVELAFNIVNKDDEIMSDEEIAAAGLEASFTFRDASLGSQSLPDIDKKEGYSTYDDLFIDPTVFYYATNEKKFIKLKGELKDKMGKLPTRFDHPKASIQYPEEVLDYSTFAVVAWTPFKSFKAEGSSMMINSLKGDVSHPLAKGLSLKDNRPNGVSFDVMVDGEWVIGDTEPDATASTTGNGYVTGVCSKDAYHFKDPKFTCTIPSALQSYLSVKDVDGKTCLVYSNPDGKNITPGTYTVGVSMILESPWQEPLTSEYSVSVVVPQIINGHECVDMGNGLKWATMNLGASNPEEYGYYFAWGEVAAKDDYTWATYKFMQTGQSDWKYITKYTVAEGSVGGIWYDDYGNFIGDDKTSFKDYDYKDDAARQNWGSTWRTPTIDEWIWLIDNCEWTWTADYNGTGKAGMVVTSKVEGYTDNSIFLPAAGGRVSTSYSSIGSMGCYWASSLLEHSVSRARSLYFESKEVYVSHSIRFVGVTVRAVFD